MEDANLVRAAQSGDTQAFGELVKRYEGVVSAVAISRLPTMAMVDDVVQDSFVAAWVHRDSLKDPSKFRPWVCGIARNLASKGRRRSEQFVGEEKLAETAAPSLSPEEQLLQAESENALFAALQEIPSEQREILALFYHEEKSVRDVSLTLGLSESTAQKRISRARRSLKEHVTSVLETGMFKNARRVSVSAGVLTILGHSGEAAATVSHAATQAATTSAAHLSTQVIGGILTMKTVFPVAAALTLLIGGAVAYSRSDDNPEQSPPDTKQVISAKTAAVDAVASKPKQPESSVTSSGMRRIDPEERAARFAKFKQATTRSAPPVSASTAPQSTNVPAVRNQSETKNLVRKTVRDVLPLVRECYEMSEVEIAQLSSTVIVKFHVSNEPEIAGLVTEVSMARPEAEGEEGEEMAPIDPVFSECLEETFLSLEFSDLNTELDISYPFRFSQVAPNLP